MENQLLLPPHELVPGESYVKISGLYHNINPVIQFDIDNSKNLSSELLRLGGGASATNKFLLSPSVVESDRVSDQSGFKCPLVKAFSEWVEKHNVIINNITILSENKEQREVLMLHRIVMPDMTIINRSNNLGNYIQLWTRLK